MLKPKVGIIGAGNVGMRYAYSLMISGLSRSIVIVDRDRKRTEGEVLDLASCMPYVPPVEIASGDYADLKDSNLIVITAGKKQSPGQTRIDLVKDNVDIFKQVIPQVMKATPEATFLVVTNPVDVLSFATYKISGKPWQQVLGSGTVLDSARLRLLLARHCNIDARNIHAYILGEHGDTEFPVWSKAVFGGTFLGDYCTICKKCDHRETLTHIFEDVRDFAYKVISLKGETSYGIGLALVRITEAILRDENSILPVSCLVQGYYGLSDLYMSVPSVVNNSGIREVLNIKLSDEEVEWLKNSAQAIKSVIKEIGL